MGGVTAIYARISRDRDGERGGVDRQRADCEALCKKRRWAFKMFEDNDISAYSSKKRPAYLLMLDEVRQGRIERIVAWHPDRLHRHPRELEDFIDLVEQHGVDIVTVVAGEYDLSTPTGRQIARILGAVARGESEHKSERIRRKHLALAADGMPSGGGKRCYGYDRAGNIVASEAAVVREVMARYLAGEPISAIGHDLNARGVPPSLGAAWTGTTLRAMLRSARLSGQREHKGKLTKATWPPIVTPEQTTRARAILKASAARVGPRTPRTRLLAGLVFCGRCGTRMVAGRTTSGKPRYTCSGGVGRSSCGATSIIAEPLELFVVEAVFDVIDQPSYVRARRTQDAQVADAESEAAAIIQAADIQLAELADAYADNLVSISEWVQAKRRIEARAEDAATRISRGRSTIAPADLRASWDDLSVAARNAAVADIVDRVVIGPAAVTGRVPFNTDRVSIRWRM